jgi:TnpA family transposase
MLPVGNQMFSAQPERENDMTLLSILRQPEAKEFDEQPIFDSIDRKRFFDMTVALKDTLDKLRTSENKVLFLVSYAYFKAQKRFYDGRFREKDLEYASAILNIDYSLIKDECSYDYRTKLNHHEKILALTGYISFNNCNQEELRNYVYVQVKGYKSPRLIFMDMIEYLQTRKIALPRYRQFVNLISDQMQKYRSDIHECLANCLDQNTKAQLDDLLCQDDNRQYALRFLKRYNQSLLPSNIRENLDDFNRIKSLYVLVEKPFEALDLNHDGAMYLTRFVERNKVLHLAQRVDDTRHLSLIAFIAYQYFQGHDILADILLQSVQSVKNAVQEHLKEQRAEDYTKQSETFHETVVQAKSVLVSPLEKISKLAFNTEINSDECLLRIREVLTSRQPSIDHCRDSLTKLENSLQPTEKQDKVYFSALEIKSRKLQNRVSGILKSIEFTGHKELLKAIRHFQSRDTIEKTAPVGFLSDKEREYLEDDKGNFRVSLYKALLFFKVAEALKSGSLSLPYSYKYRHLDDYLIPKEQWNAKREDYIKQAGLEDLIDIDALLSISEKELQASFKSVNKLILQDKTPDIICRADGSFIVKTPKLEDKETHSISSIVPHKKDIPIQSVLSIVNEQTGFLKQFTHDAPSQHHHRPEDNALFATLIAYGGNVGIARMARITKGQSQAIMENIAALYMQIDNTKRANDCILRKIDEISNYFIAAKLRHTSSDGQKYLVDGCSLNANTSYKYPGLKRALSSYIFLDNRFAHFYATVISSAEREACYVLDGIMYNHFVKSDIHSTDTHGFTEAVFALMHMLGITFAPRLKNLSDQTLYGFKSTKTDKDDVITPKKYLNVELIRQNWDDILRFAATIKLRYASSSQLFKRLNSYSKQHMLYKALKEFGRLRKTLFILRYMQDVKFRQAIEKQLNRGENSNKFSKAVAFGNNQEILFEEKEEQEVAENCRQLIKNAIILWNYLYLVKMLQSPDQGTAQYALITLQKGNVLAWKHILLHGQYDMSSENTRDEFGLADPKFVALIHTKFWEAQMAA